MKRILYLQFDIFCFHSNSISDLSDNWLAIFYFNFRKVITEKTRFYSISAVRRRSRAWQKFKFFKKFSWNYSEKWLKITSKCANWKRSLVSSTSIISASTWPKIKSKDSFEKLRTHRFWKWPYFLNLVKIWGGYG